MIDIHMNSILNIMNEKNVLTVSRKNINMVSIDEKIKVKRKINAGVLKYQKFNRAYHAYLNKM